MEWKERINGVFKINHFDFPAYLRTNPFKITKNINDIDSFELNVKSAADAIKNLGQFGEISNQILIREIQYYDHSKIISRCELIRYIANLENIDFFQIQKLASEFLGWNLKIRNNETSIKWFDGSIIATYPKIDFLGLNELNLKIVSGNWHNTEEKICFALLNCLKILIVHPFDDGNGRISRILLTAQLINALDLEFVPFIEPFARIRNFEIAQCINKYLETGDQIPFLFAYCAAIRDSLCFSVL